MAPALSGRSLVPRREGEGRACRCWPGGCRSLCLRPPWEGACPPSSGVWLAFQRGGSQQLRGGPGAPGPALCPGRPVSPTSRYTLPVPSPGRGCGETRPHAGAWTYPSLSSCPWRGLDLGICHLGWATTALAVFSEGLGKAWRQGTGPSGLCSLPSWSTPSFLPCFLPATPHWNPDPPSGSWWCAVMAPVWRKGGPGPGPGPLCV